MENFNEIIQGIQNSMITNVYLSDNNCSICILSLFYESNNNEKKTKSET
jgi:hypothetical protein